jgi:hypothetical protein
MTIFSRITIVTILKETMNNKLKTLSLAVVAVIFTGLGLHAQTVPSGRQMDDPTKRDTVRSIAAYFIPATKSKKTPDSEGFIQRWLLLEPIDKPNRSNTVFTDSYIREAFDNRVFSKPVYCSSQRRRKGKSRRTGVDMACTGEQKFNVKLFRFAYGLNKPGLRSPVLGGNRSQ